MQRFRYSSVAIRRNMVAVEGVEVRHERARRAPPYCGWSTGVSTSTKPRASSSRRRAEMVRAPTAKTRGPPRSPSGRVALAVAGLRVAEAGVLLRRRPEDLASTANPDAQRELAAPRPWPRPRRRQVAQVQSGPQRHACSPISSTRAWSWMRPVRSTRTRNAILPRPGGQRAARRRGSARRSPLAVGEPRRAPRGRRRATKSTPGIPVRERVDALGAQAVELVAALG